MKTLVYENVDSHIRDTICNHKLSFINIIFKHDYGLIYINNIILIYSK